MALATFTEPLRERAYALTDDITARLKAAGVRSDTLDRLYTALANSSPTAAQTASNELELVMSATGFLPDDSLAKLRYLLAEGDPRIAAESPTAPAPVWDVTEVDAADRRLNSRIAAHWSRS